ncbi:MAG: OB-fold putative lipoprotein [Betaproteobacteria bacterium]|nr:OB-fold putative lipoprotein [Betaproteobacteria bacterium]
MKKIAFYVVVVLLVLVTIGAIFGGFDKFVLGGKGAGLSSKGVRLVTNMLYDDVIKAMREDNALFSVDRALEISGIAYKVTSAQFSKDFSDDEAAANKKYKGKKILVVGKIDRIGKDDQGNKYYSIKTGGQRDLEMYVRMVLIREGEIANLKKDDTVYLVCNSVTKIDSISGVKNCIKLTSYLNNGERFSGFVARVLSGKEKVSEKEAEAIIYSYIVGNELPDGSTCYTAIDQACVNSIDSIVEFKNDEFKQKAKKMAERLGVSIE